ncbi:peroxidase 44-like [Abrus precatorius]|uniref:peroxidase n=1 Tax=Abrus precatorius TaxID=3816 RepID=A0A8B8L0G6_ABRPR|nr:peroxidase 44-like [Abrus precatorius]
MEQEPAAITELKLAEDVKPSMPKIENAREFMAKVKEYAQSDIIDKSITCTLLTELTIKKFDWYSLMRWKGPFAKLLESRGIYAQYTMPSTPQQNGVAERRNRTIMKMIVAYLLNRVPSKAIPKTPYELWTGKKPSLRHLHVWGYPVEKMKIIIFFLCFTLPLALGELKVGFYGSSCPKAESIVQQMVQKRFNRDKSITAALLRLHFHDCAVRGCDASILIDSTDDTPEKESGTNEGVRGFDLIDEVKESLEAACPSTVSCADIITLATRDAVALSGGPKYDVPTGRRDGLVSNANDIKIPGPSNPVSVISQFFASKGITTQEMVTLFGAHTVGVAHCSFFSDRFSNSQGKPDPTMDPSLSAKLMKLCNSTGDPATPLDQKTSFLVDNQFYKQILVKRGVLEIDQQLALDTSTKSFVSDLASNEDNFENSFASAMIKMGKIDVLVGNQGEIRKKCSAFNNRN